MGTILVTAVLASVIAAFWFIAFRWLKTPYYRVDQQKMITTLEMVLTGQATENQWFTVFGMPVRHSMALEEIRQRCLEIEESHYKGRNSSQHLFSAVGLDELKKILAELKSQQFIE